MKLAELETIPVSKTPTTVLTANGEVQTKEAQVYVHGLNLFVTLQILEDTPAVLSLGNSAKITDIPVSGPVVKNHTFLNRQEIQCITENSEPNDVPGLPPGSSSST